MTGPDGAPSQTGSGLARRERTALLDLMAELGPHAPTLCAGWTTHDLAAHLVTRERQPLSVPGYVSPALAPVSGFFERRVRPRHYEDLLATLRSGPPFWSPLGPSLAAADDLVNLHEFYVHHEDVRRLVDPSPRPADAALDAALWARLRVLGPLFSARARGVALELVTPGAQAMTVRRGSTPVLLRGTPRELFLWFWGRRDVAHVEVEGDAGLLATVGPP